MTDYWADKGRLFVQHVPGCVEADPYILRFTTWEDLEARVRHHGRIGCTYQDDKDEKDVMLIDVFESKGEIVWWVLGRAHNGPGIPPWPYWKDLVRELGGRV